MVKPIYIGTRAVGPDYPPLVIAELGINHEGSLKTAFEMVDAAARAGAEVLKHQTHVVEDEMSDEAKKIIPGNADVSIFEIMKRCALSEEEEIKLKAYVESKGMTFISTPFSRAAAERLRRMDIPAYKIGSGECNNFPLLEHIATFGKPVILSTGMNSMDSILKAVSVFRKHNTPLALLHCTNVYPTPPRLVRLGAMVQMMDEFPETVVGLSDHTTSSYTCLGAVALGACILERHFTDHMQRHGPDIVCSMDEDALRQLITGSRIIWEARGGKKGPVAEEKPTIDFAYASVVSIRPISKGELFTRENIWVKRPGTGEIKAEKFEQVLGKSAQKDIPDSALLCWSDIKDDKL
ncbi:MAG: N-acetylneuraminate synthase family protein [Bacteroidia bacterium]